MELFLHIQITKDFPKFDLTLKKSIGVWIPSVTYFDIDNQSEPLVINTAQRALDEASKVFVWIDNQSGDAQRLFSIIKHLAKVEKSKPMVIAYNKAHPVLLKLAKGFQNEWVQTGDVETETRQFFTS